MAVELANAYVTLVASAKGIGASLENELGKPAVDAASKAGDQAGKSMTGGFTKSIGGMIEQTGIGQKAMSTFGLSSGAMGAAAVGGVAVAGTAIAKFALDGAAKFGALGESVQKFATVAGVPAETASRFIAVADDYGVSADSIAGSVGKLGKTLGANEGALDKYGVAVVKGKDGNVDMAATTFAVIDAYNATVDPTKKAALGAAAFGKSYQDMIPLITQGSAKIKSSFDDVSKAQIFDDKKVADALAYRLAMDDLHDTVSDLQMTLGRQLIPVLVEVSKSVTGVVGPMSDLADALPSGSLLKFIGILRDVADPLKWLLDVPGKLRGVRDAFAELGGGGPVGVATQAVDAFNKGAATATTVAEAAAAATAHVTPEVTAFAAAYRGNSEGMLAQIAWSKTTVDTSANLVRAYQGEIDALHGVQSAMLGQTDATLASQQADLDAAIAVDTYTKQLKDNKASQRDHQQAFLDVQGTINDAAVKYSEYKKGLAEVAGAEYTARDATRDQITSLQNELAAVKDPALRAAIQAHIDQLNSIPTSIYTNVQTSISGNAAGKTKGARAAGGPFTPGTFLVGERGPELVTMTGSGWVTPNDQLGSSGPSITVNNYREDLDVARLHHVLQMARLAS
jgi:hypothetical protein